MNKENIVQWDDIYHYWRAATSKFPELQGPLRCLRADISEPKYGPIYYYDWVEKENAEAAIQKGVTALASGWPELGTPWSKGTIRTACLLVSCKTEEELAAVWLCASSLSLLRNGAGESGMQRGAADIELKTCKIFARKYGYWHSNSRDIFPELYIPMKLLRDSKDISVPMLLELAVINAALVMAHFTPVEYKKVL